MVFGNVYASRQDTAHGFLDYLDESLLRLEAQLPQAQIIIQGEGGGGFWSDNQCSCLPIGYVREL